MFLLYAKLRDIEIYWNQAAALVSLAHFLHDFQKKIVILLPDQIALSSWLLLREILGRCVLQSFVNQVVTFINLKINLIFLINRFFCLTKTFFAWPKCQDKNLNILITKELLRWNSIFIIFWSEANDKRKFGRWKSGFEGARSGLRQCLASESSLKVIKKCFLFHLKSSSFLRYWNFRLELLVI